MGIKDMLNRFRERRALMTHTQDSDRVNELVTERKLSDNERELEKFLERDRQTKIKSQLSRFKEQEKVDARKMTVTKGKNIFKGHDSLLKNNDKLLNGGMTAFSKSGFLLGG